MGNDTPIKKLGSDKKAPIKPLSAEKKLSLPVFFLVLCLMILVGVGVGFAATKFVKSATPGSSTTGETKGAGIFDKKTFPDSAEGVMKEGGIEGEGSFHLERPGGESQNVYLTSSAVDLSKYLRKKVKVWGQTFTAQKAGWLMDVGYVEVK